MAEIPHSTAPDPVDRQTDRFSRIIIRPRGRGFILGWTGSGKSTLAVAMLERYHALYSSHVLYLLDPKGRYIPVEREEGDHGIFPEGAQPRIHGSREGVAVLGEELTRIKRPPPASEGPAIYVVQDSALIGALCRSLYRDADVRRPSLLFADESFDLMSGNRALVDFRRLTQQGRERGIGMLVINQEPAYIDRTWLTQSQQLYVGRLVKWDDRQRVMDVNAVPQAIPLLTEPMPRHTWLYIDQEYEAACRFRLDLNRTSEGTMRGT